MEQGSIPPRSSSLANPSHTQLVSTSSLQIEQGINAQTRTSTRGYSDSAQSLSHHLSGISGAASIASNHGSSRLVVGPRRASGGETWKDFLRETGLPSGRSIHRDPGPDRLRRTRTDPVRNTDGTSTSQSHDYGLNASRKRVTSTAAEENQARHRPYDGSTPSTSAPVVGSAARPIDLTSPAPPSRPLPQPSIERQASNGSIILPRWQPDQDVASCPVCGTPFSIWYRRHHCRKCGRVVCSSCSPHRITIPRQFIVHPPHYGSPSPFAMFGAIAESGQTTPQASDHRGVPLSRRPSAALGGGEVVRVCNPCVPDPNLSPPPQMPVNGPPLGPSSYPNFALPSNTFTAAPLALTTRLPSIPDHPQPVPSHTTSNYVPPGAPPGLASFLSANPGATALTQRERNDNQPWQPHGNRMTWLQSRHSSVNPPPAGPSNAPPLLHSPFAAPTDLSSRYRQHRWGSYPGPRPNDAPLPPTPLPPPPLPPRHVKEEDECPICGRELPPKGSDGDETARERHVEECIRLFSLSSSSVPKASGGVPASANIPIEGSSAGAASSASASTSADHRVVEAMDDSMVMMPPPTRPNQHRMLVYQATEKDCVGEDGERQECVICFEEFEEGDEMGRLDCLCKFHRACIRQWWNTKGVGSCPTHQLHQ